MPTAASHSQTAVAATAGPARCEGAPSATIVDLVSRGATALATADSVRSTASPNIAASATRCAMSGRAEHDRGPLSVPWIRPDRGRRSRPRFHRPRTARPLRGVPSYRDKTGGSLHTANAVLVDHDDSGVFGVDRLKLGRVEVGARHRRDYRNALSRNKSRQVRHHAVDAMDDIGIRGQHHTRHPPPIYGHERRVAVEDAFEDPSRNSVGRCASTQGCRGCWPGVDPSRYDD